MAIADWESLVPFLQGPKPVPGSMSWQVDAALSGAGFSPFALQRAQQQLSKLDTPLRSDSAKISSSFMLQRRLSAEQHKHWHRRKARGSRRAGDSTAAGTTASGPSSMPGQQAQQQRRRSSSSDCGTSVAQQLSVPEPQQRGGDGGEAAQSALGERLQRQPGWGEATAGLRASSAPPQSCIAAGQPAEGSEQPVAGAVPLAGAASWQQGAEGQWAAPGGVEAMQVDEAWDLSPLQVRRRWLSVGGVGDGGRGGCGAAVAVGGGDCSV